MKPLSIIAFLVTVSLFVYAAIFFFDMAYDTQPRHGFRRYDDIVFRLRGAKEGSVSVVGSDLQGLTLQQIELVVRDENNRRLSGAVAVAGLGIGGGIAIAGFAARNKPPRAEG